MPALRLQVSDDTWCHGGYNIYVHVLMGFVGDASVPIPLAFMLRYAAGKDDTATVDTKSEVMRAWFAWCHHPDQRIPVPRMIFFDGATASFNGLARSLAASLWSEEGQQARNRVLSCLGLAAAGATPADEAAAQDLLHALATSRCQPPTLLELMPSHCDLSAGTAATPDDVAWATCACHMSGSRRPATAEDPINAALHACTLFGQALLQKYGSHVMRGVASLCRNAVTSSADAAKGTKNMKMSTFMEANAELLPFEHIAVPAHSPLQLYLSQY